MGRKGSGGGSGQGSGSGGCTGQGKGMGPGRMGGPFAAGPKGYCVCPNCGHRVKHLAGKPCNRQKCAKCGTQMTRDIND